MDDVLNLTAFEGDDIAFAGPMTEVSGHVRAAVRANPARVFVVLDDSSGRVVDIDLREPEADQKPARGRGRPKLGVAAREVTLLPRHWDWLAAQPGGASAALRRLVEQARRSDAGDSRAARDAAYAAMTVLAGDRVGYEAAVRALYAGDIAQVRALTQAWPDAIGSYLRGLPGLR